MRMSCNGCRVLRKGCSDDCAIRPCLQWIKSPESQANATVFLAKFYGRAGLINLIAAGPNHLRPAIFRSLLYEACGRIVNPIYGSVGLLWSGSWSLCQAAVEAVLKGEPIAQIPSDAAASAPAPPLKAGDIRHVSKRAPDPADRHLHKVARTRNRSKRSTTPVKPVIGMESAEWSEPGSVSAEGSHVSQAEPEGEAEVGGLDLDLNLGLAGGTHHRQAGPSREVRPAVGEWDDDACQVELELRLPAM